MGHKKMMNVSEKCSGSGFCLNLNLNFKILIETSMNFS